MKSKTEYINELVSLKLASLDFWEFCKLKESEFYLDTRPHLKELCNVLNDFHYNRLKLNGKVVRKLIINLPPQFGKTRTLVNFTCWTLGRNRQEKIITASYNDTTAKDFSKYARNAIEEVKNHPDHIVFSDIFPDLHTNKFDRSSQRWAIEGEHFSYIGAGVGGSITSKGATLQIVDDPVKDLEEAMNENALEKIYLWYGGTFSSRVSAKGGEAKVILNHTRWAENDLCGRLLKEEKNQWYIFKREAYNEKTDTMLCEDFLSWAEYQRRKSFMIKDNVLEMIFFANYHQRTIDSKDILYRGFKTYTDLPIDNLGQSVIEQIRNYTDSKDEGSDFLCSVNYAVYKSNAYVTDVYYTQDSPQTTEKKTAEMFTNGKVNLALIEANAGGAAFGRNVNRICVDTFKNRKIVIKKFHQSKNKKARILSNSHLVVERVFFPTDWSVRWPQFYEHMTTFKMQGTNKQDDAPDTLTGIVESMTTNKIMVATVI